MRVRWKFLTIPVLWVAFTTSALADSPLAGDAVADRVVILKARRELQLMRGGKVLKTYRVALGPDAVGQKEQQGDGRTPEGIYTISGRNVKSSYHRSLRVSYPTPEQREAARRKGVDPGGDIFIHGLPNGWGWIGSGHRLKDWTLGCVAVSNDEIEEIWRAVPDGTVVEIRP